MTMRAVSLHTNNEDNTSSGLTWFLSETDYLAVRATLEEEFGPATAETFGTNTDAVSEAVADHAVVHVAEP